MNANEMLKRAIENLVNANAEELRKEYRDYDNSEFYIGMQDHLDEEDYVCLRFYHMIKGWIEERLA